MGGGAQAAVRRGAARPPPLPFPRSDSTGFAAFLKQLEADF